MTGFSWTEEGLAKREKAVPYNLEEELKKRGAKYSRATLPFVSHVVEDGLLITGQNPASAAAVGEAVAKKLMAGTCREDAQGRHRRDSHGNAPDKHPVALLLMDVINPLDFPEAAPHPNSSGSFAGSGRGDPEIGRNPPVRTEARPPAGALLPRSACL